MLSLGSMTDHRSIERRIVLQGVLAAGAAASTGAIAAEPMEGPRQPNLPEEAPEGAPPAPAPPDHRQAIDDLLDPLRSGDMIGLGWSLAEVSHPAQGAVILTLAHDSGGQARVHLCKVARSGQGVAQSDNIDFMLMNRAGGAEPTDEVLGRVIKTLAELVRGNERRGAALPPNLLPHSLRLCRYGRNELL
jgi:hypothetical protein